MKGYKVTLRIARSFLLVVVIGMMPLGEGGLSNAKVLEWQLQNVKFDDGGPVSGSFFWDADASPDTKLVAWDISITSFHDLPAYHFNSVLEPGRGFSNGPWSVDDYCRDLGPMCIGLFSKQLYDLDPVGRVAILLVLAPDAFLSNAGGTVAIGGYEDNTYGLVSYGARSIVSGHLVAVPEPSEGKLFALTLALLIAVRLSARAIHHLKFENSGHPSLS